MYFAKSGPSAPWTITSGSGSDSGDTVSQARAIACAGGSGTMTLN